jgi:hypothetical protein
MNLRTTCACALGGSEKVSTGGSIPASVEEQVLATFIADESAATSIEYGLIAAAFRLRSRGRRRPLQQLEYNVYPDQRLAQVRGEWEQVVAQRNYADRTRNHSTCLTKWR